MNNDVAGLILSFIFIFGVLVLSELLVKVYSLPKEESRKFVHIGVGNWWLIAMLFFTSWRWAIIPPVVFIVLNLVSWYTGIFGSMERKTRDLNNLGTVYYPIALLALVVLTWHDSPVFGHTAPYIGGLGILAMGYGDGLAALIGTKYGKRKFRVLGSTKSLEGSLAMFFAAFIALAALLLASTDLFFPVSLASALALAALGAAIEALTPRGLDNLTVPLAVSLAWLAFI